MHCVKQGQSADARPPDAPTGNPPDGPPGAPPDTTIVPPIPTVTNLSPVSFSFTSTKPGTFLCSIDGGAFTACSSPQSYSNLTDGQHTFAVKAVDLSGQQDDSPATATFTLDRVAPDTTITGGPTGTVDVSEAVFTFTCTEPPCTFQCQVDSGAFSACDSGNTFDVTTIGDHTFRVKATDKAGNEDQSPAERTWTVRTLSLQTIILTGPSGRTQATDASFTFECRFAGNVVSCTFVCTLDGSSVSCTSPKMYSQLAEGTHTFQVVATTTEDHVTDPSPAERIWVIDHTPPVTTIITPTQGEVTGPPVTFSYSANEDATFECDLGSGFAGCDAAGFQQTLSGGSHTFSVRATDLALNVGGAATVTWTVDAEGPVVTVTSPVTESGPGGTLDFTFTDLSPPVTFRCDFGQGFVDCAPGFQFQNLSGGSHTVNIEGTDKWGNKSITPFTWTVDATGPTVNVTSPQPGAVVPGTGAITWSVPTADATHFVCTIDGGAIPCSGTSLAYDLPSGQHTFAIVAFDKWENPSVDPPSISTVTFTVDADAPVVVISSPANGGVVCNEATVVFDTDPPDDFVRYQCAVGGGSFGPCNEPSVTFPLDASGTYTVRIIATDEVGNQSAAATVTFQLFIDVTGPLLDSKSFTVATPPNTGQVTLSFTVTDESGLAGADAGLVLADCPVDQDEGRSQCTVSPPVVPSGTTMCSCSATSLTAGTCTCNQLAAGRNFVAVRARDRCGNVGDWAGAFPDVPFAPFEGHAVVIGHDYTAGGPDPGVATDLGAIGHIVGNAVALAPWVHRGYTGASFNRAVRVLGFRRFANSQDFLPADDPGLVSAKLAFTRALSLIYGRSITYREFTDFNHIDLALAGHDVLVVYSHPLSQDDSRWNAIVDTWNGALQAFVDKGGVVVVLNGTFVTEGIEASGTHTILSGGRSPFIAGLDAVLFANPLFMNPFRAAYPFPSPIGPGTLKNYWLTRTGIVSTPWIFSYGPFVGGTVGFDNFYSCPGQACIASNDGAAIVYEELFDRCGDGCNVKYPVVVDKTFPEYGINVSVGPQTGTAGTGTFTVDTTGVPRSGFTCFLHEFPDGGTAINRQACTITSSPTDTEPGTFSFDVGPCGGEMVAVITPLDLAGDPGNPGLKLWTASPPAAAATITGITVDNPGCNGATVTGTYNLADISPNDTYTDVWCRFFCDDGPGGRTPESGIEFNCAGEGTSGGTDFTHAFSVSTGWSTGQCTFDILAFSSCDQFASDTEPFDTLCIL